MTDVSSAQDPTAAEASSVTASRMAPPTARHPASCSSSAHVPPSSLPGTGGPPHTASNTEPAGASGPGPAQAAEVGTGQHSLDGGWDGFHTSYSAPYAGPSQLKPHGYAPSPSAPGRTTGSDSMREPPYYCQYPGCRCKGVAFTRKADLKRHYSHVHPLAARTLLDCPRPDCRRRGEHGFRRRDQLAEHLREVHAAYVPRRHAASR